MEASCKGIPAASHRKSYPWVGVGHETHNWFLEGLILKNDPCITRSEDQRHAGVYASIANEHKHQHEKAANCSLDQPLHEFHSSKAAHANNGCTRNDLFAVAQLVQWCLCGAASTSEVGAHTAPVQMFRNPCALERHSSNWVATHTGLNMGMLGKHTQIHYFVKAICCVMTHRALP